MTTQQVLSQTWPQQRICFELSRARTFDRYDSYVWLKIDIMGSKRIVFNEFSLNKKLIGKADGILFLIS